MKSEKFENGTVETWTTQEVSDAFASNEIVLIDVRTPQEFTFERIGGALLARGICPASRKSGSCCTAARACAPARSLQCVWMREWSGLPIWRAVWVRGKRPVLNILALIWQPARPRI